jgi:hypothetical protein
MPCTAKHVAIHVIVFIIGTCVPRKYVNGVEDGRPETIVNHVKRLPKDACLVDVNYTTPQEWTVVDATIALNIFRFYNGKSVVLHVQTRPCDASCASRMNRVHVDTSNVQHVMNFFTRTIWMLKASATFVTDYSLLIMNKSSDWMGDH